MSDMTPEILERIGVALFGPHWQTPLARSLGMNDTSLVRKWLTGKATMRPATVDRLMLIMAMDEWIIGTGPDTTKEYITHTRYPRFIARIVSQQAGDQTDMGGLSYICGDGDATFCEFVWIDKPPIGDELLTLLQKADAALEANSYSEMDHRNDPHD